MSLDTALREHIASYLAGELHLLEFEDWFYPATWGIDSEPDVVLIQMVYDIKLLLAEYTGKHKTEDEVRAGLRTMLERGVIGTKESVVSTGTSATTQEFDYWEQVIAWHRERTGSRYLQMQEPPPILQGKYPQCVLFTCQCGHAIQVERSMSDIIATGYTCQGCKLIAYRVVWGASPDETRIEAGGGVATYYVEGILKREETGDGTA